MERITDIWPTVGELARDMGVPYTTAHSWVKRGRIPADYDLRLVEAARKRGSHLSLAQLAMDRARRSKQGGPRS